MSTPTHIAIRHGLCLGCCWLSTMIGITLADDDGCPADDRATESSARDVANISPARNENGVIVHDLNSPYQSGTTRLRILLPAQREPARRFPLLVVLPVEAGETVTWGDSIVEVQRGTIPDAHGLICVFPTFSALPWYADHPTDPGIRQESYLLQTVIPFVEENYPVDRTPSSRLLVGFSKSGWGAWSLLLRHPSVFGRAAAFDAPMMLQHPNHYGTNPIFGTQENFDNYRLSTLLPARTKELTDPHRLILLGRGNFHSQHEQIHSLMNQLQLPHTYRDSPQREHSWHSGWLPEAIELLMLPN